MALLFIAYERLVTGIYNAARRAALRGPLVRSAGDDAARIGAAWIARAIAGEVTIELRRGNDYSLLDTTGPSVPPCLPKSSPPRSSLQSSTATGPSLSPKPSAASSSESVASSAFSTRTAYESVRKSFQALFTRKDVRPTASSPFKRSVRINPIA